MVFEPFHCVDAFHWYRTERFDETELLALFYRFGPVGLEHVLLDHQFGRRYWENFRFL